MVTDSARVRAALVAAGHPEPIPAVGQVWRDITATWPPGATYHSFSGVVYEDCRQEREARRGKH
jgi:hypothetical protein